MQYSLEKISTVVACDALLASAQKKKLTLERKTRNLGESIDTFRERLDQIGQDTVLVQALRIAYTAAYNALPEGSKDKANMNVKVKRLELRQARLEKKTFTCNERALLAKEVKYNRLVSQIAALSIFVNALENRRTALLNAELNVDQAAPALPQPVVTHISPQTGKIAYKGRTSFSYRRTRSSFWKSRKFLRLQEKFLVQNIQDQLKI
jgi:hypothetical protein